MAPSLSIRRVMRYAAAVSVSEIQPANGCARRRSAVMQIETTPDWFSAPAGAKRPQRVCVRSQSNSAEGSLFLHLESNAKGVAVGDGSAVFGRSPIAPGTRLR